MFRYALLLLSAMLFLVSCTSYDDTNRTPSVEGEIVDNQAWYSDVKDEALEIRVTTALDDSYQCAPYDDPDAPLRACTFEDVLNDDNAFDDYKPVVHVNVASDDFTSSPDVLNASMKQKGKSTRLSKQDSFRIKLDSKDNLIFKERTLQINKHPYDPSRIRQKLSFDLFQDIPNLTSAKTRFVNLIIDEKDYGLFTHVERTDKYFLRNRGWGEDDHLYKAQNFDFRYTRSLELSSSGKPLDKEAFEERIEPANGKDFSKLIAMIHAIDEATTDAKFETMFKKTFNRENYITWMAVNIVLSNKDTVSQNFFLYNPLHSEVFYFLPWDYDGIGRDTYKYAKWELGIGTWWDVPLHRKFLSIKKNRDDLDKMVYTLVDKYITPENVQKKLDRYRGIIEPFISSEPDNDLLSYDRWVESFDGQIDQIALNVANYESQKGAPMPYWQNVSYKDGELFFYWDESIDLEGDEVVYDLRCADNVDFNNSIVTALNLSVKDGTVTQEGDSIIYKKKISLNVGDTIFMQVIAKEKNNPQHYQIAFDQGVEIGEHKYFGLLEYTVE